MGIQDRDYKMHVLKTWPEHFLNLKWGYKTFELRKDDRDYTVGDLLYLQEYDPITNRISGDTLQFAITHILRDAEQFGLMPGYCILSIKRIN